MATKKDSSKTLWKKDSSKTLTINPLLARIQGLAIRGTWKRDRRQAKDGRVLHALKGNVHAVEVVEAEGSAYVLDGAGTRVGVPFAKVWKAKEEAERLG